VTNIPEAEATPRETPMKRVSDLFSYEEKKQLRYLTSMLDQESTDEEQEQQKLLEESPLVLFSAPVCAMFLCRDKSWISQVSAPVFAREYPQACRSMCG
jgi:hypothetical protein